MSVQHQDSAQPALSVRHFTRILGYLRPYIPVFAVGTVASVLFGLSEAGVPWLMRLMLDADDVSGWVTREELVYVLPIAVFCMFFLRGIAGFIRNYCLFWLEHTMVADVRRELIAKLMKLPQSYHDREASGVLISRFLLYANRMTQMSMHVLNILLTDIVRLVALAGTILFIDWRMALLVLVAVPIALGVVRFIGRKIRRHTASLSEAEGHFTAQLADSIQGQRAVKSYGGSERETALLDSVTRSLRGFGVRQGAALALNRPLSQMALAIGITLVMGLLAASLLAGDITEGELGTFLFATALLPVPLRGLAHLVEEYQQALVASDRVFQVLDSETEEDEGNYVPEKVSGAIEFTDVRFAYSGSEAEALAGVSMKINVGERVALVGPTGSGKTTLSHLLMRLYPLQNGRITLDGHDIHEWRLDFLRSAIGLVAQDVLLFDTTIAENVAYPARGAEIDQGRLQQALENAALADKVASLPEGVDTLLGERGLRLSGGERQRMSIARAFYKDAPILVLDEATSSLDALTEEKIRDALNKLLHNRSALIIAHRFATVEAVDRIVLLDHGRIVGEGTHAEMFNSSQMYRSMYEAQQLEQVAGDMAASNGEC